MPVPRTFHTQGEVMNATSISLIAVVSTLVMFGTICFIAWTTSRAKTLAARAQAEAQIRLIDRFQSGPELVEFLQSEKGRQFVRQFQEAPKIVAANHVLGGIQKAVVVGMLGLGFLAVALFWPNLGMIIPGFLFLSLAIGFAISTAISVRVARSWRLLPPQQDERSDSP
jgi:hypothetical protein